VTQKLRQAWSGMYKDYGGVFAALLALQVVSYGYLFTTLIFTNHTFPQSWVFSYPTQRTWGLGRWLNDLITWFQGGSGVQPFQMAVSVTLQTLNGILFARFLGLERRLDVLLAAALLCLYPAFLDNYSFAFDNITFAVGDTFALLGILYFANTARSAKNAAVSGILFVLSLASYQPKIALIGLLCICYVALSIAGHEQRDALPMKEVTRRSAYLSLVFVGACLVYFISARLTMTHSVGPEASTPASSTIAMRAYVNSIPEMLLMALGSYGSFLGSYTVDSDYLPRWLRFLPALGIALGSLALLYRAYRRQMVGLVMVAGLLLLIPITIRASYILNKYSWEGTGRIVFVNGYALLFFVSCALQAPRLRKFVLGMLGILLYCLVIVAAQESNAAAFKTVYDLSMLNRIASRIETVVEDLYQTKHALVVVGRYPTFARCRYVRNPNSGNQAQVRTFAFPAPRQPWILNYFFGRDVLLRPTPEQVKTAVASAEGRRPWPAKDSVYTLDDVIVVVMENSSPGMPPTPTAEGSRIWGSCVEDDG
jgi:Glucosyl transferase GtrII